MSPNRAGRAQETTTADSDVAIVGAGAAGVAAAVVAARSGCSVTVLDNGPAPGGQYYRGVKTPESAAGLSYVALRKQFDQLHAAGRIDLRVSTNAYALERNEGGFTIRWRGDDRHRGETGAITARTVIIATGAYDRPLPFPGWTLPGVMSGGGAQALVKGSGVVPGHRSVVAGTGPFLLAVATSLLDHGANVAAVIEANDPLDGWRRTKALTAGLGKSGDLARFGATLARHRVPYLRRHRVIEAIGNDRLSAVRIAKVDREWHVVGGTERTIDADTLAVGFGFIAQTDLAAQVGTALVPGRDGGLAIAVDVDHRTSIPGLLAAGETTGIAGVDAARVEGLVAGATAAAACGMPPALTATALDRARSEVARWRRFAAALHATFPVRSGWRDEIREDTVICRCEEVPAMRVREAVADLGARDARTVKLLTRAGMGWCQGRICAAAVNDYCGFSSTDSLAGASYRPITVPVPLGALAAQHMEG